MSIALADSDYGYHRFSVKEFHELAESGAFAGETRMELIGGIFFDIEPPGPFHCSLASQFVEIIRNSLSDDFLLREEKPIVLSDYSMPIPDISIVKQRPDDRFFANSHPSSDEVQLVIEISDSSYLRDRNVKLQAYAQAEIPEYWIVNAKNKHIEWFRSPQTDSSDFTESGIFESHEAVALNFLSIDLTKITF